MLIQTQKRFQIKFHFTLCEILITKFSYFITVSIIPFSSVMSPMPELNAKMLTHTVVQLRQKKYLKILSIKLSMKHTMQGNLQNRGLQSVFTILHTNRVFYRVMYYVILRKIVNTREFFATKIISLYHTLSSCLACFGNVSSKNSSGRMPVRDSKNQALTRGSVTYKV